MGELIEHVPSAALEQLLAAEALSELLNHRGFRVDRVSGSGRTSRIVGTRFPLALYGSSLLVAERRADT